MNFTEHPPSPFYPPTFPVADGFSMWHHSSTKEQSDVHSTFDFNPAKRFRYSDENPSISVPQLPNPMNTIPPMSNPPLNKGIVNIFFKTRMCTKFVVGTCRNGESCKFAHGNDDLRKPPENWQELVSGKSEDRGPGPWDEDHRIIHRMKLCKKFYNGEECPYGDRCNFLHEDPSKFRNETCRIRESAAISIGTTASPPVQDQVEVDKSAYWKTRLCTKFETSGQCPFGDRCHFAHGVADLQVPGLHHQGEKGNTVVSALTRPSILPSSNAAKFTMEASSTREAEGVKFLLKWKGPKKINRIYADWLDDLPLPFDSPVKALN